MKHEVKVHSPFANTCMAWDGSKNKKQSPAAHFDVRINVAGTCASKYANARTRRPLIVCIQGFGNLGDFAEFAESAFVRLY